MDVDALLSLRADIDSRLGQKRNELEEQLSRLRDGNASRGGGRGRRASPMKGRKVPPKYRGPGGETWAGRGARPRWLTALIKQGRKIDDFAIGKSVLARKGSAKKSRRKRR
jgi:DNA-binding protein H-NS